MQVRQYINGCITAANAFAVSNAQKIQKFEILPVDFSVSGNELVGRWPVRCSISDMMTWCVLLCD